MFLGDLWFFLGKAPQKVASFPSHQKGCVYKFICKCVSLLCPGANLAWWQCDKVALYSQSPRILPLHFVLWTGWVDLRGPVPTHCLVLLKFSPAQFLFLFLLHKLLQCHLKPSLGIPGASPTTFFVCLCLIYSPIWP